MANYASIPPCAQLQMQKHWFGASNHIQKAMYPREHFHCNSQAPKFFGSWKASIVDASFAVSFKKSRLQRVLVPSCYCIRSMVNPENVAPLNWVPVLDQILLMTSIVFAYMAGVVPHDKVSLNARRSIVDKDIGITDSTISGRFNENESDNNFDFWSEVKGKLLDAMDAFDHDASCYNSAVELEKHSANHPLSLLAISGGPRLRLLCITLQWLQKEVTNMSQIRQDIGRDAWLIVSSGLVQGSVRPIFAEWLAGELLLGNKEQDKELIGKSFGILNGDESVVQKSIGLEKTNLYADLLFFLKHGSFSTQSYYNNNMLSKFANDILEDLVITLADGVSNVYLELISVDSNISSEINDLGLCLCSLSTRKLQKLRNEVALNAWLQQNFESVVSMYEDRFVLCVLRRKSFESNTDLTENVSWWKKFSFGKMASSTSPLNYVFLTQSSMFVKRTKELRVLKGWRYYYSLFLEFSDITMPLVRAIFIKVRDAVSFLFVCLIGRSLGLIYTGIRQSLSWR